MSGPEGSEEPDLSGAVLGRHRLVRRLGRGGMGAVYLAQHELLDRQAAIKVLNRSLASKELARKRFLREARAASKVKHPGIVEIYDVAYAGDTVFFVMELLRGRDLAERLNVEGRMSWAASAPIVVAVAEAIAAAHEVGVIHRDIKPSNCFLVARPDGRDGMLKMVDFGIAKVAAGERTATEELTTTGEVFGTVGYMPPEMAQGIHDEPRSDLYELGVMMFRMLTGRLPFTGPAVQVIAQHIGKAPPKPRSLEPSIPEEVERIILRALEKLPEDRQPSMRHMAAELKAASPGRANRPATRSPKARSTARSAGPKTSSLRDKGPAKVTAAPAGPQISISKAAVIDLDERPAAPTAPSVAPDPWKEEHARTTAYGDEPPPPPMPDEPDLPPAMFRPAEDPSLRLAVEHAPTEPAAPRQRSSIPSWLMPAVLVLVIGVGGAIVLWIQRAPITEALPEDVDDLQQKVGLSPEDDASGEPILLLIDTVPKDARVYVDDERRTERPIRVPRSEEYLKIRVEADGYEPRKTQVQPLRTRRLEVKLDRSKKRKKNGG